MEPIEHFGIYFGYIRRLFQSWVSPFKVLIVFVSNPSTLAHICQSIRYNLVSVLLLSRFVKVRCLSYGFKGNNPPPSFFSKTLSIIFTIQFYILFSETLIISQTKSWVSQNNRKVKKRVWVNRTQRHGASQSHSSCCELIGHRRPTDEVVRATATTQRPLAPRWLRIPSL